MGIVIVGGPSILKRHVIKRTLHSLSFQYKLFWNFLNILNLHSCFNSYASELVPILYSVIKHWSWYFLNIRISGYQNLWLWKITLKYHTRITGNLCSGINWIKLLLHQKTQIQLVLWYITTYRSGHWSHRWSGRFLWFFLCLINLGHHEPRFGASSHGRVWNDLYPGRRGGSPTGNAARARTGWGRMVARCFIFR